VSSNAPGAAPAEGRAVIYKIVPEAVWRAAEAAGRFGGAGVDLADGYIHFSTAAQVRDTAAKHFAGVPGLLLVAVDTHAIALALRWEPSRGGDLFPHLYQDLPMSAVQWAVPLPVGLDGRHTFPASPGL
jgi:uncharacterized protein (DUF952 family)